MKINQVFEVVNSATAQALGKQDILNEDLSNVVDVGNEVINARAVDNYVESLVNHIGRVVFDSRAYATSLPSVIMDSWEFGSVLEKITADIPEAHENDTWNLVGGQEYKQDTFYQPSVSAKFFNSKTTFEVPVSFTERQVKESFSNAEQLNGFISMIENAVAKSLTIKLDSLIMRTINNMTAETLVDDLKDEEGALDLASTGKKAINLLALYNGQAETAIDKEKALRTPDFIRFASYIINLYADRVTKISSVFNVGGKERFTPVEDLNVVLLSDFASASKVYLESDTYNSDLVKLPNAETVPFWQGSGSSYEIKDVSKISVKTSSNGELVTTDGILGVMFDKYALGVTNLDQRVTTHYNAKAEFYNNFYKSDAGFFNDLNENYLVFFIA